MARGSADGRSARPGSTAPIPLACLCHLLDEHRFGSMTRHVQVSQNVALTGGVDMPALLLAGGELRPDAGKDAG